MKIKKIAIFFIFSLAVLTFLFVQLNKQIELTEINELSEKRIVHYTVKEYEGKVAIFRDNETEPFNIYNSYVSVLPDSDQKKLKKGITVSSTEELQEIIEDYTS